MLDKISDFLAGITGGDAFGDQSSFASDDPRVAAGALMYHVIQADGVVRDVERKRFEAVIRDKYALDRKELQKLIDAAKQADDEAVDLYRFTSILMRHLSREQCVSFVEILWEMVYADGVRHELEDNVVWRVSELLGVSGRDRVMMRQRVQERLDASDETPGED